MTSFELHQPTGTTAGSLLLTALAAPIIGFSQPVLELATEPEEHVATGVEPGHSGERSEVEELIDTLATLAIAHQESGDHDLAVVTLRRALDVIRPNYGLYSLEQGSLLRQLIRSEEARGNAAGAWDLEQELLTLARRHPDDRRTVPILRDIADKRIAVLEDYLSGGFPPQIILGCFYDASSNTDAGSCKSGSRSVAIVAMLSVAMQNYAEAIGVMLRNELYASAELRELEMELVRSMSLLRDQGGSVWRTSLFRRRNFEPWLSRIDAVAELAGWGLQYWHDEPSVSADGLREREIEAARNSYLDWDFYALGRLSFRRLVAYEIASASPWPDRVRALVRLADWDLMHSAPQAERSDPNPVLEAYEQAYALATEHGMPQEALDALFSPETPVLLPAFAPNPLAAEETPETSGYVDVAFDITRFGRSEHVEILDSTPNARNATKNRLERLIARSRFRPIMADGRIADTTHVVVRYYLNE